MIDNGGDSNCHAAQLPFRKRFDAAGLLLSGSYTRWKSIDDLSIDPVRSTVAGTLTTNAGARPMRTITATSVPVPISTSGMFLILRALMSFLSAAAQSGEPSSVCSGVFTTNFSAQSRAALRYWAPLPEAKLQAQDGVVVPVFFQNAGAFTFRAAGELGLGTNIFQRSTLVGIGVQLSPGLNVLEPHSGADATTVTAPATVTRGIATAVAGNPSPRRTADWRRLGRAVRRKLSTVYNRLLRACLTRGYSEVAME